MSYISSEVAILYMVEAQLTLGSFLNSVSCSVSFVRNKGLYTCEVFLDLGSVSLVSLFTLKCISVDSHFALVL